ncbi:hypothetical protein [Chitiniphilus eburneus]|uniref:DUF1492 domain-containing protein n=1 Tax=Chitiniphilus eburneus TaxID=2571148 RepID=A0A4U0PZR6_9NEIS|nr:hypothetical protein [Chitiniphilus eburneus]TJZ73182.1 hypothetical protein FAZ21_11225 [Chitiniphilus eburneus]
MTHAHTDQHDADQHLICEQWATWCHTRRFYGPAPTNGSALGKLCRAPANRPAGGPDAISSAHLASLHLAIIAQPQALDRQVFELHYLWRVRNIKRAADELGISRAHWYRLLNAFRARIFSAAHAIQSANDADWLQC